MKKQLNYYPLLLLLVLGTLLGSCSLNDDEDGGGSGKTIAEIASETAELSTLVTALERTGLATSLNNPANITVLAPTNSAFDAFLAVAGFASINDVPTDVLEQILYNHIIPAYLESTTFTSIGKNYVQTLASGPDGTNAVYMYLDPTGSAVQFNGVSNVISADNVASNGIIHVVDAVIDLPTVSTFIMADDNFDMLQEALSTATPNTDFLDILTATGPFTVFAPNAEAFQALLDSDPNWTTVDDIDETLLTAVLQHHVANGNNRSEGITTGQTLATLEGDEVTFNVAAGSITITDGAGNEGITVLFEDVQAANGLLHIVEAVLLPDTTN